MGEQSSQFVENCAILCFYADSSGNFSHTFRDNVSVSSSKVKNIGFMTPQDEIDRLSRNVGKKLSLLAA